MNSIDKTLEYHELIMSLDCLDNVLQYALPKGYAIEFFNKKNCITDWIRIHLETGEFASPKEAETIFHLYYDDFYEKISERCFFIVDINGTKVATATISPTAEYGYPCTLDWLGVSASAQGKGLGKPLIAYCIKLAKDLGYDKILLHTQTHTWLAAKLYLDFGFKPIVHSDIKGWNILKTVTDHDALQAFEKLKIEEMYDPLIINIKRTLDKLHNNYYFSVWYKDGRKDVFVNEEGKYFHYNYCDNGNILKRVK